MEADEVSELRRQLVGKTISEVTHDSDRSETWRRDWQDDEPLLLTFTDGATLEVNAYGYHGSGCLGWTYNPQNTSSEGRDRDD